MSVIDFTGRFISDWDPNYIQKHCSCLGLTEKQKFAKRRGCNKLVELSKYLTKNFIWLFIGFLCNLFNRKAIKFLKPNYFKTLKNNGLKIFILYIFLPCFLFLKDIIHYLKKNSFFGNEVLFIYTSNILSFVLSLLKQMLIDINNYK